MEFKQVQGKALTWKTLVKFALLKPHNKPYFQCNVKVIIGMKCLKEKKNTTRN